MSLQIIQAPWISPPKGRGLELLLLTVNKEHPLFRVWNQLTRGPITLVTGESYITGHGFRPVAAVGLLTCPPSQAQRQRKQCTPHTHRHITGQRGSGTERSGWAGRPMAPGAAHGSCLSSSGIRESRAAWDQGYHPCTCEPALAALDHLGPVRNGVCVWQGGVPVICLKPSRGF